MEDEVYNKIIEFLLSKLPETAWNLLSKLKPKQTFAERLRTVIDKTMDEYSKLFLEPYNNGKQLLFYNSEDLIIKIIDQFDYNNEKKILDLNDFKSFRNVQVPTQDSLDQFISALMNNIYNDDILVSKYYDENFKQILIDINNNTRNNKKDLKSINESIEEIKANSIITPKVINALSINDKQFTFDYKLRETSFIGRKDELQELYDFVNSEIKFSWWILVGSGGVGKSRLADELCRKIESEGVFNAGFMQSYTLDLNKNWNTSSPCLYIIDYAARNSDNVLNRIIDFSIRTDLKYPIRLLLIEREVEGEWWEKFKMSYEANSSLHKTTPLNVNGLIIEDLIEIVQEIIKKENKELQINDSEIREYIYKLDYQLRPLFAMFIGVALAEGKHIRDWNQHELLKFQLDREAAIIHNKFPNINEFNLYQHKNLVNLATLYYGIDSEGLNFIFQNNISWLPSQNDFNLELYSNLASYTNSHPDVVLVPLLPDILGEFYVLEHLKPQKKFPFRDSDRPEKIIQLSYDNSFFGLLFFFRRIFQDFPRHETTKRIFSYFIKTHTIFNGSLGRDLVYVMNHCSNKDDLIALWGLVNIIYIQEKDKKSDKIFMDTPENIFQKATFILITKKEIDFKDKIIYYNYIKDNTDILLENRLNYFFVDSTVFVECETIYYLISNYKFLENDIEIKEIIERLKFINSKTYDPRIKLIYLQILLRFNLINIKDIDKEFISLYNEIKTLSFVEDPRISLPYYQYLFIDNSIEYYLTVRISSITALEIYLDFLYFIYQRYSDNNIFSFLLINLTSTLYKASDFLYSSNDIDTCNKFVFHLKEVLKMTRGDISKELTEGITELFSNIGEEP
jgi:hypothetical protein